MSNSSWKIGRLRGIQLEIHFSFLLLLGFYAYIGHQAAGGRGALALGLTIILVFVSVALHELGHSFTAQHYGIKVPRIVLLAIGGMAQMGSIPREPKKELIITINGPLVNFALALILFTALAIANQSIVEVGEGLLATLKSYIGLPSGRRPFNYWALNWETFAWNLLAWNIAMGLFNLLPIFPMDGGRLLRAGLATRLPYLRATQISAALAKVLAGAGIAWALLNAHYLLAILLVFIWIGGDEEVKYVRLLDSYLGKRISEIMARPPLNLEDIQFSKPHLEADELVDDHLTEIFSQAGAVFPVYLGEELVGVIYADELWDRAHRAK